MGQGFGKANVFVPEGYLVHLVLSLRMVLVVLVTAAINVAVVVH